MRRLREFFKNKDLFAGEQTDLILAFYFYYTKPGGELQ